MTVRGINKVIIVDNLGQDPEVRYMPNGGAVANLSLATSESCRSCTTCWHPRKRGAAEKTVRVSRRISRLCSRYRTIISRWMMPRGLRG